MFKLIKIIVLLAILAGIAVGVYIYTQSVREDRDTTPGEFRSQDDEKSGIRVEEKYGFTSEGVDP